MYHKREKVPGHKTLSVAQAINQQKEKATSKTSYIDERSEAVRVRKLKNIIQQNTVPKSLSTLQAKLGYTKVAQLKNDEGLIDELIDQGYKGPMNGQYMSYTGANASAKDVDWKAHIGTTNDDKRKVFAAVSPILKEFDMSHKFDVNIAKELHKFVTIYPPKNESDWAAVISMLEQSLAGIATIIEPSTEPVGAGLVSMRHGQINALTHDTIAKAGIEITSGKKEIVDGGSIAYFNINRKDVWEGQKGELCYVDFMRAFFFKADKGFQAAIIWEGKLRADPRKEWNPFEIQLPEGVETTESLLVEYETELLRIEHQLRKSIKRIDALNEEGNELIAVIGNKPLVDHHNFKMGQEYETLDTLLQRIVQNKKVLKNILGPKEKIERTKTTNEKLDHVETLIKQQIRRLDVIF